MQIILLKTIPRSGATGLISSFKRTFETVSFTGATSYIKDVDFLISQGVKFQDEILQAAPLADCVMLKTHRTYASLKIELDQCSTQQPVLINLFRPPFDVAVSTYFYLMKKWSLIDPAKVSLFDYAEQWALKQGNDNIFINNGYPSYIQYAHNALQEKKRYPDRVLSLTYHEATNERRSSFSKIVEVAYKDDYEKIKFLTSHFTDFNLQQARETLGLGFVYTGGGGYINDSEILSILNPEQVEVLKKLYATCFAGTLNEVNEVFSLNLTCC